MSNPIPTSKSNPCPICGEIKGKCRQGREDQNYWQCMTYADTRKGETINGFKCIGLTKDHQWAQFKPDNSQEWTEKQRLEWQREKPRQQNKKARAEEALRAKALPIDERDKAIRLLHQHFGLSARHREDLNKRGLSDEAIEKNLYFSITPNQKVPHDISANLPGIKYGQIKAAGSGYACIAFSPNSKATGWQIRLDGVTENKYRWAKGEASSHLSNGELPITSAYPQELKRSFIGMCEGILKASVAAEKHGQIMLGASSANFPLQQLQEHLDAASSHLGGNKRVEFATDAGCLSNYHVMKRYASEFEKIRKCGYEPVVVWWGQIEKSAGDIDEISDLSAVKYISTDEFLKLGELESWEENHGKRNQENHSSQRGLPQQKICKEDCLNAGKRLESPSQIDPSFSSQKQQNCTGLSSQSKISQEQEPFKVENSQHIQKRKLAACTSRQVNTSTDEFLGMVTNKASNEVHDASNKSRHREAENAIYHNLTTIQEKPWKVINTPKINLQELLTEPGVIYIVSSAKGTHKTNALVPVVESQDKVLAWFNRVALGREECHRIGLTWKDETKSYSNKNKRGFCADSSFQFNPNILADKGLLIGDECDQVFAHMFGDTCNKDGKRPLILATLEAHIDAAIHGGGMALFMSADVTQRDIDYIKALAPEGCPVRLIVNEFKPERGTVYYDTSDKPDGQIEELLMKLEAGIPCFAIDDIKNGVRGCKSIAEYIRSVHPEWVDEIVEINSDTSGDQFVIDYLKNINEVSKKTRFLCCSPSVVSGISIENGHFEGVFAFLNGILTVSDASQAIARVRGAKELYIWAAEEGLVYEANRSTNPEEIKAWYRRNYEANCKHLLTFKMEYQPITGEWASPHFDLFCKNAAYRNLCMSRLRERLQARLEEEGYNVIVISNNGSDAVENALKTGWNQIEIATARAVEAANILSEDELEALRYSNKPPTPEEKLDLQKTYLLKWFGRELIEATTYEHKSGEVLTGYAAMALKNERGVYREQLENFRLLVSEEDAAVAKDIAVEAKQLRHSCGRFPGDVRWNTRRLKARLWLELKQFLNPEKWWRPNDYRDMGQKAKTKASMVKDSLNLSVEKMSEGQIFGELIQQLGLQLDKEWVTPQLGGKRFKQRRIAAESWNHAQMYLAHQQRLREEREATHKLVSADETTATAACDSECANLITPPQIYIEGSFLGGGDQEKSQVNSENLAGSNVAISALELSEVEQLVQAFEFCDSIECFKAVIEGESVDVIRDAIALLPTQPLRKRFWDFYEQVCGAAEYLYGSITERVANASLSQSESLKDVECERPSLGWYKLGSQVWAYFAQFQRWGQGIVESIEDGGIQIASSSGIIGAFVDSPEAIAPGDWVM